MNEKTIRKVDDLKPGDLFSINGEEFAVVNVSHSKHSIGYRHLRTGIFGDIGAVTWVKFRLSATRKDRRTWLATGRLIRDFRTGEVLIDRVHGSDLEIGGEVYDVSLEIVEK